MMTLFVDGAGWNGQLSRCAFVLYEGNECLYEEEKMFFKEYTNNQMEYSSLIYGLKYLAKHHNIKSIERIAVRSDSQLVVNQINGVWKVKDTTLKRAVSNAIDILNKIRVNRPITVEWTRREKNRAGIYIEKLQRLAKKRG